MRRYVNTPYFFQIFLMLLLSFIIFTGACFLLYSSYVDLPEDVFEQAKNLSIIESIFFIFNKVIFSLPIPIIILPMLLLIALLGTYNVLDIWIKKRKKEITIKRAVGATKNNIIFEFILTLFIISCFSYFF